MRTFTCVALTAMITFTPALASAQPAPPVREVRCDVLATRNGQLQMIEAPDLHVLAQTAPGGQLPVFPSDANSIMCGRTSIIPAAHDDQIIYRGVPLFLAEIGTPGRLGVLEINEGVYRFRMLEGALTANENAAVQAQLRVYQARLRR